MTPSETDSLVRDAPIALNPMFLFRWEASQQAYVLLYPEGVVKLNETAGAILQLCDGERNAEQIAAAIDADYADDVRHKVFAFLEESHAKGWIRTDA